MQEAVIIDCVRTAAGKAPKGTLRTTRPDDLAAIAIRAVLERHPQINKDDIEDVILGCATPEGMAGVAVLCIRPIFYVFCGIEVAAFRTSLDFAVWYAHS